VDELDHLPLVHLVQVLPGEHHQMLEVHYQNLLRLVPEFVLQVLVEVPKSVVAVEPLVKE
jgi:hypothetical protein